MSENLGLVSQLDHGSFVNGCGIKTNVFLKGCLLTCLWCCRPEAQKASPEINFTSSKYNVYRNCIPVFPFKGGEDKLSYGTIMINRALSTTCGHTRFAEGINIIKEEDLLLYDLKK